jgi:hypothetical protein
MAAILANPVMIEAYQSGIPGNGTKIRSELGHSYLASAHFQPGYGRVGIPALAAGTQPSEAVHVLTIMKNLLQAFADGRSRQGVVHSI